MLNKKNTVAFTSQGNLTRNENGSFEEGRAVFIGPQSKDSFQVE